MEMIEVSFAVYLAFIQSDIQLKEQGQPGPGALGIKGLTQGPNSDIN